MSTPFHPSADEHHVLLNGRLIPHCEASVPIDDRGFLYGDGVFTTLKVVNGEPIWFEDHISRLKRQCAYFGIGWPEEWFSPEQIYKLIHANRALTGTWKMRITLSAGDQETLIRPCGTGLVTLSPYPLQAITPLKITRRHRTGDSPLYRHKTLAYLYPLWVRREITPRGFDDCLLVNEKEMILEGTYSNIFWIDRDNHLFTPTPELPILEGIWIKKLAERYPIHWGYFPFETLHSELRVFFCNCLTGAVPVHSIDKMTFRVDPSLPFKTP